MKKIYMIPTIKVVKIETHCMTGASEFNENLGGSGDGGDGSKALSRKHFNVWGDDDDDL